MRLYTPCKSTATLGKTTIPCQLAACHKSHHAAIIKQRCFVLVWRDNYMDIIPLNAYTQDAYCLPGVSRAIITPECSPRLSSCATPTPRLKKSGFRLKSPSTANWPASPSTRQTGSELPKQNVSDSSSEKLNTTSKPLATSEHKGENNMARKKGRKGRKHGRK